jgi:hypothetical protein
MLNAPLTHSYLQVYPKYSAFTLVLHLHRKDLDYFLETKESVSNDKNGLAIITVFYLNFGKKNRAAKRRRRELLNKNVNFAVCYTQQSRF